MTASMPVTQCPVTPYLNACGPPALHAMLPPIWLISAAPGSGGKRRPFSRASRWMSPVVTPASTWMRHSRGSNWRTRFIRSKPITTPPTTGIAPPARRERDVLLVAPAHHRRDLFGGGRKHDRVGSPLHAAAHQIGEIPAFRLDDRLCR